MPLPQDKGDDHVVPKDGVETDPDRAQVLLKWPILKNTEDLKQFLGFTRFYRRFMKGYSQIVEAQHFLL